MLHVSVVIRATVLSFYYSTFCNLAHGSFPIYFEIKLILYRSETRHMLWLLTKLNAVLTRWNLQIRFLVRKGSFNFRGQLESVLIRVPRQTPKKLITIQSVSSKNRLQISKWKDKQTNRKTIVVVLSLSTNEECMLNLLFSEWNICSLSVRTS